MTHCRRGIENLVEREQAEIHRHQFHDGAHSSHRRSNAGAGKSGFRERRIANPLGAEFGKQPVAHRIAAAITADVLTHQKNAFVAFNRIAKGLAHRFTISQLDRSWSGSFLAHGSHRPVGTALSAYVKRVSCSTGSQVPASAKATASATSTSISASRRGTSSA